MAPRRDGTTLSLIHRYAWPIAVRTTYEVPRLCMLCNRSKQNIGLDANRESRHYPIGLFSSSAGVYIMWPRTGPLRVFTTRQGSGYLHSAAICPFGLRSSCPDGALRPSRSIATEHLRVEVQAHLQPSVVQCRWSRRAGPAYDLETGLLLQYEMLSESNRRKGAAPPQV